MDFWNSQDMGKPWKKDFQMFYRNPSRDICSGILFIWIATMESRYYLSFSVQAF